MFLSRPHRLLAFGNFSVKEKILWKYKIIDTVWKQFDLFFVCFFTCGLLHATYKRMIRLSFDLWYWAHWEHAACVCGCVGVWMGGVTRCGSCRDTRNMHRWPNSPESFICTCVNSQQHAAGITNHLKDIGKIWNSIKKQKQYTMCKVIMQRQTDRGGLTHYRHGLTAWVEKVYGHQQSICIAWCINIVGLGIIITAQTNGSQHPAAAFPEMWINL